MREDEDEVEKGKAVTRATTAVLPESHLAPWMSDLPNMKLAIVEAKMSVLSRVAEKADKNKWRDEHPNKPLPKQFEAGEEKDERMAEEFDVDVHARGAAAAYAYGVGALVQEIHDRLPSVKGLRTKQAIAIAIGAATRTGTTGVQEFEQKKGGHWWSRKQTSPLAGIS